MVPKAQHAISLLIQPRGALLIRLLPQSVLPAVKFDDKPSAQTKEINDKWAKSMLSTELCGGALPGPEVRPEDALRIGLRTA